MNFINALNALHNVVWAVFLMLIALLFFSTALKGQPILGALVDGLNRVKITVWMIVILAGGIFLTCCGQKEQGSNLIIGAFAILRAPQGDEHPADTQKFIPLSGQEPKQ